MFAAPIIAAYVLAQSAGPQAPVNIVLGPGTQRVMTVESSVRAVGHAPARSGCGRIDVKPIGSHQLLITGVDLGRSRLVLFGENGPERTFVVNVREAFSTRSVCELCSHLPKGFTVDFRLHGGFIYVVGTMTSIEEALAVRELPRTFSVVKLVTHLHEDVITDQLLEASHKLWRAGLLDHRAVLRGQRVVIAGPPLSAEDRAMAEAIVEPWRARLEVAIEKNDPLPADAPANMVSTCADGR